MARKRIECWIEALAMFGLADGVPVAAYGPARVGPGRGKYSRCDLAIGGPTVIEPEMRTAAIQRAVAFGVPAAPLGH